ncbi:MAG: DNA/RNA non-specific endonuclease [Bacteroidales bacterium]|nr:DNA/RNA non-specific endonuclease [Bacteroidales bacterium]
MKRILLFIVLFLLVITLIFLVFNDCNRKQKPSSKLLIETLEMGSPDCNSPYDHLVKHTFYHLSYNEAHEQANWVVYFLSDERLNVVKTKRRGSFRMDKLVTTGSASLEDYRKSGYDRGHLVPAADMKWSEVAMKETFYFSNVSPQKNKFNGGIWLDLEKRIRDWAKTNESVYIVTGPVLADSNIRIGPGRVTVPEYFYKVILDISPPDYKGIAFLLQSNLEKGDIFDYAITIDSLENFTGLDFFANLDDQLIEGIEKKYNKFNWY